MQILVASSQHAEMLESGCTVTFLECRGRDTCTSGPTTAGNLSDVEACVPIGVPRGFFAVAMGSITRAGRVWRKHDDVSLVAEIHARVPRRILRRILTLSV